MSAEDQEQIWVLLENGETLTDIGKAIGRSITTVRSFVLRHGGQRPPEPTVWSDKRMCLTDREEISRGLALDESFRTIAERIDRAPSTVSREVNANGGRREYRAVNAEASVRERAKRPKKRRLECDRRLRRVVEAGLEELWSPTQISKTLRLDYPADETMQVSPETIYEAIYHGVVDRKPQACLRTKRRRRVHRHRRKATGPGVIKNRVMIKDRPAHIEDRLEVGHWEGDLIVGNRSTALATLVERMTRYTVLVQLPGKRTMEALNASLEAAFAEMADPLVRTLTWDQGKEIAGHTELAAGDLWIDPDTVDYAIRKAGAVPSSCSYDIFADTTAGRPDVPGWTTGTFRSTSHLQRRSVGAAIGGGDLGASLNYWK